MPAGDEPFTVLQHLAPLPTLSLLGPRCGSRMSEISLALARFAAFFPVGRICSRAGAVCACSGKRRCLLLGSISTRWSSGRPPKSSTDCYWNSSPQKEEKILVYVVDEADADASHSSV